MTCNWRNQTDRPVETFCGLWCSESVYVVYLFDHCAYQEHILRRHHLGVGGTFHNDYCNSFAVRIFQPPHELYPFCPLLGDVVPLCSSVAHLLIVTITTKFQQCLPGPWHEKIRLHVSTIQYCKWYCSQSFQGALTLFEINSLDPLNGFLCMTHRTNYIWVGHLQVEYTC